jgi:hypothetical protein
MFKPKSTLAEANKAGVGLNVVVSGKNANSARNIATITESYGLENDEMQKVIDNLFSGISKDQTESIQKLILIRLLMSGRIVFKEKSSFLPFMFSVIGKQYRPKFTSLKDQTEFNRETEDMLKNLNNDNVDKSAVFSGFIGRTIKLVGKRALFAAIPGLGLLYLAGRGIWVVGKNAYSLATLAARKQLARAERAVDKLDIKMDNAKEHLDETRDAQDKLRDIKESNPDFLENGHLLQAKTAEDGKLYLQQFNGSWEEFFNEVSKDERFVVITGNEQIQITDRIYKSPKQFIKVNLLNITKAEGPGVIAPASSDSLQPGPGSPTVRNLPRNSMDDPSSVPLNNRTFPPSGTSGTLKMEGLPNNSGRVLDPRGPIAGPPSSIGNNSGGVLDPRGPIAGPPPSIGNNSGRVLDPRGPIAGPPPSIVNNSEDILYPKGSPQDIPWEPTSIYETLHISRDDLLNVTSIGSDVAVENALMLVTHLSKKAPEIAKNVSAAHANLHNAQEVGQEEAVKATGIALAETAGLSIALGILSIYFSVKADFTKSHQLVASVLTKFMDDILVSDQKLKDVYNNPDNIPQILKRNEDAQAVYFHYINELNRFSVDKVRPKMGQINFNNSSVIQHFNMKNFLAVKPKPTMLEAAGNAVRKVFTKKNNPTTGITMTVRNPLSEGGRKTRRYKKRKNRHSRR